MKDFSWRWPFPKEIKLWRVDKIWWGHSTGKILSAGDTQIFGYWERLHSLFTQKGKPEFALCSRLIYVMTLFQVFINFYIYKNSFLLFNLILISCSSIFLSCLKTITWIFCTFKVVRVLVYQLGGSRFKAIIQLHFQLNLSSFCSPPNE